MARRRPRTRSVVSPISITLLVTALNAGFGVGAGVCQALAPPLREPSMRPARRKSHVPLPVAAGPWGTPIIFGFRGLSREHFSVLAPPDTFLLTIHFPFGFDWLVGRCETLPQKDPPGLARAP